MTKLLPALSAFLLFAQSARSTANSDEAPAVFVSRISRNLEIVTQVSDTKPFVGQQFAVIYSMRALQPPSAVDLDPQQYAGFWTELARLPEQPRSKVRLQGGQAVSEYLLRQVIAFPLWSGSLDLPPLRVKVKYSSLRVSSSDWDVTGTSIPVRITARALTPAEGYPNAPPLVGELEGTLSAAGPGSPSCLLLELKGTANLALLQPKDWLSAPRAIRWSIRLKDWDDRVQTLDMGDSRRLTLLQWRRWLIRPIGQWNSRLRIKDMVIPVYQPGHGSWSPVHIRGLDLNTVSEAWSPDSAADLTRQAVRPARRSSGMVIILCSAVLIVLVLLGLWLAGLTGKSGSFRAQSRRGRE